MDIKKIMGEFRQLTGVTPRFDGPYSCAVNQLKVDILRLDKDLAKKDPEYDADACTYQGKPGYSMGKYLEEKYGARAAELCEQML